MSSVCISNCVRDTRAPLRATYVNLYKWPESDAEFMRSMSFSSERSGGGPDVSRWPAATPPPRVVDSISCRQMYLRSYPFSREEELTDRKAVCFGGGGKRRKRGGGGGREREKRRRRRRPCLALRKVKDMSLGALFRIFHRLLSCSASVDVVD
ncbi:hypothetical protein CDL15_Pgr020559 [Punica granatum]|uniref:Uncharacterized protein n=1 Tax=Punica granatum TaxID=22663 RepID=A0A218VXJ6_PUNGR|nr:hypothetical protein CDL15_Pgr020559 [Punica granatum]PKI60983.1 hypothetical protein CRG98_018613 [Punica granatum]